MLKDLDITLQAMLTLKRCLWGRLVEILLTSKIRQIRHPFTWVQIRIVHLSENLPERSP